MALGFCLLSGSVFAGVRYASTSTDMLLRHAHEAERAGITTMPLSIVCDLIQ